MKPPVLIPILALVWLAFATQPTFAHPKPCTPEDPVCKHWSRLIEYPKEAQKQNLKGTVAFEVTVAVDGHVKDCRIVKSSGHQLLDESACVQITKVAHFEPALDVEGNPVEGTWGSKITWGS